MVKFLLCNNLKNKYKFYVIRFIFSVNLVVILFHVICGVLLIFFNKTDKYCFIFSVFLFYDGIEISAVPNLVLDPLSLHLEKHADECDRIILLLLNKNAAGLYDHLEQELTAWYSFFFNFLKFSLIIHPFLLPNQLI